MAERAERERAELDKLFAKTDFTKRDEVIQLFPLHKRLQLASRKPLSKHVHIELFTMKTPFGDKVLLDNTDLIVEPHKRQGLIGPNCSGKTLLFHNILNGNIPEFPKHLHVHHCKELEEHEMHDTVLNTVVKSNEYRNILLRVEEKIKELLTTPNLDAVKAAALKQNLEFVVGQVNAHGGRNAEEKASKMLRVLGFDEVGQKKLVKELSGGLKMRVALCMAFTMEADLLLLDEPTNHLDFPSVLWLENRLRGYKGSFLLVSHDRQLLNNVCTSVCCINEKKLKYYACGFAEFEKKKAQEDQKTYNDIEKFLARNKDASPTTPLGRQVMDKRAWAKSFYEKQIALQTKFTFPASTPLEVPEGQTVSSPEEISLINLQNVRFSYNPATGHFIFNDPISFNVKANTRCGVMGPNGAGKSTLLKLLTHKLTPTEGTVVHHPNFKLAYFGQHSTAELDLEMTAMEFMTKYFPTVNSSQLRNHLAKTGIIGNVADTRIQGLSYSQRSCIVFAKLTFAGPHLLIMDEPTNFLDLESVDSLIGACNKYKGALLLVSHNRDFLKKCATQYLSVVPGHFEMYNDLKTAEKATYTFIQEMEEGQDVSAKSMIMKNPGGGSIHSSQKVDNGEKKEGAAADAGAAPAATPAAAAAAAAAAAPAAAPATGAKTTVVSATPAAAAKPAAAPAAAAAAAKATPYTVGEKVQAKYTQDGRWYNAVVKGIKGDNYTVTYTDYGNTETLPVASVRKFNPPNKGGAAPKGGNHIKSAKAAS